MARPAKRRTRGNAKGRPALKRGHWYLIEDQSGERKVRALGRDGIWWTPLRDGWISSPAGYVPIVRLAPVATADSTLTPLAEMRHAARPVAEHL